MVKQRLVKLKIGMFVLLAVQLASAAPGTANNTFKDVLLHCDIDDMRNALRNGASANWTDQASGQSALHYAVACEPGLEGTQYGLVQMLLGAGAAVSATTVDGESVLERALLLGSQPTVELLLQSGADPNSLATTAVSMLALAQIVGNDSAVRALELHGATLLATDAPAIDQWGGIGRFARSIDAWDDRHPEATADEYHEALMRYMHEHLGDQLKSVNAFEEMARGEEMAITRTCCDGSSQIAPAMPAARATASTNANTAAASASCSSDCARNYDSCVSGCGRGWAGNFCRLICGRQRRGCKQRCDLQRDDPPAS